MEMQKHPKHRRATISPTKALHTEVDAQVQAGVWNSRTDFYETAGWMMLEIQRLGLDMARGLNDDLDPAFRALERSDIKMSLNVTMAADEEDRR